jgi:UDP-2,4-diacetamido-2,4,6-trideoxy-beta-L-altropyranose hydrolase
MNMMHRILIRADARTESGLGHVVRMLALAEMLSGAFLVDFLCEETVPSSILNELALVVERVFLIPSTKGNDACLHALCPIVGNYRAVIIDQYQEPEAIVVQAHRGGCRAVRIVDMPGTLTAAELCFGHSLQEPLKGQGAQVRAHGIEYALVREVFYRSRVAGERAICYDALVSFGGLDPLNSTLKVVHALSSISGVKRILVVVGGAYAYRAELENYRKGSCSQDIQVVSGISGHEFAQHISSSNYCFTPASGTALEVGVVGSGLCIGVTSDDQQSLFSQLIERGLAFGLGDIRNQEASEIGVRCQQLFQESGRRDRLIERQCEVYDGKASQRVQRLIRELLRA